MRQKTPLQTAEVYTKLVDSVIQRYRTSAGKSLLDVYQVDSSFLKLDPGFLEFTFTRRDEIEAVLADPQLGANLVNVFVDAAVEFTYQNNQFVHLNQQERDIFTSIYQDYLARIRVVIASSRSMEELETEMGALVETHFHRLRANISRFFDPETAPAIHENIILQQAVCSEYSPELQLRVLGIELQELVQPVLDLGCGKTGQLVKHLRTQGVLAYGVDRVVEPDNSLLRAADWFDLELQPEQWGTIISHMAFSNHFLFHHRYKNGQPEQYARQYMKILIALKVGGSFYYSPGLPFIEQFLPAAEYTVLRQDLPDLQQLIREDVWYASRVIKQARPDSRSRH